MYKLLIEDDEGGKTAVSLIRDEITIGRKEGNTIRLTDRNVSRRHGRIVREDAKIFVEDVAARYGIKKNGKRINDRAELKEGDVVLIGDYRLTLRADAKAKKKKEKRPLPKPKAKAPGKSGDPNESTQLKNVADLENDFSENERETTQIMQTMPAKLVVVSSNFAGEEFPLSQKEMVIGRGDDCNIIIDHRSISQKHAKIVREDNVTYKIVDLKSKNGVKVSGDTYRATHLKRGDVVELGHVKFRFVEPGENYVFQPQADKAPAALVPSAGGGGGLDTKKLGILGGAIVAGLFLVGLVVIITSSDSDDGDVVPEDADADAVAAVEEIEETGGDLSGEIEDARAKIESGELSRTMDRLELILELSEPSDEEASQIEELLRQARNEQPFKRSFETAGEELADGNAMAALDEATSIPSHSLFYDRLRDEGTLDAIFDALLEQGQAALGSENFERARELADEVTMVSADYAPALTLLSDIEEAEREIELAQEREAERQANAATRPVDSQPSQPSQPAQPAQPSMTAEEAQAKYTQAAREVTGGNPREAIRVCNEALEAGHTACHRILGLAYGRLDDSANACRHFQQYLATGPSNPGPVERQMESQGCD